MTIHPTRRVFSFGIAAAPAFAAAFFPGRAAAAAVKDDTLVAMLPADLRARGTITIATEPLFPPFQYTGPDNRTLVGLDIDLGDALGQVLGMKMHFVGAKFDEIIPGLEAKRYDLSIDAMADTAARRKTVDFVDYFQSGSALFVRSSESAGITSLDALCGHKVGVVKGTFQVEDAEAEGAKCAASGGRKLAVLVFPDQASMILAISSGRVDAILMDSAVGNYLARDAHGEFRQVGSLTTAKRKGIVIPKGETGLRDAIQGAMQELIDDGIYATVLKKYNQGSGAIPKATINDGNAST
ncbi:MAG: ABC transporter substrate-binding protein [Acetobacteraceae bacterium]